MRKVLVVDDSEVILDRIGATLKEMGCTVVTAINGAEAIQIAKNDTEISLVIADILMPGIDGIEMCTKIRELPQHKDVMIMICTTEASKERKDKAREIGVACWLIKPIQYELLKKAVTKLFQDKGM